MNNHHKALEKTFHLVSSFLDELHQSDSKVITAKTPQDLAKELDLSIPKDGESIEKIFYAVKRYLTLCVKTGHNNFFNQLFGGFNFSAFLLAFYLKNNTLMVKDFQLLVGP